MSGRGVAMTAGVALVALAVLWWTLRPPPEPKVIEPGTPIPDGETVKLRFEDEDWTLSKRETTREESLSESERRLPEPEPVEEGRPVDESARALDSQARDSWRSGDLREALALFEQAVESDPDDWVPRAHLGRLLAHGQELAAAREHLERAAALAPEDPQRWLDLRSLYERSLDLELAFEARARAEALAGDRPIAKDWAGFWVVEGADTVP